MANPPEADQHINPPRRIDVLKFHRLMESWIPRPLKAGEAKGFYNTYLII
jgi:hypothetical protein